MLNGIFIDGIPVLLLPCFNPLSANPTTWLNTQTICRQTADEWFECVFDHFVGLALKGLKYLKIF